MKNSVDKDAYLDFCASIISKAKTDEELRLFRIYGYILQLFAFKQKEMNRWKRMSETDMCDTFWGPILSIIFEDSCVVLNSENNISNSNHGEGEADITSNVYNPSKTYKNEAVSVSGKEGFYVDGDLHEILSLFDVLLLKENDYSNKQWEYFGGTASLEKIRNAAVDQYVDSNVKFDTYIYNQISEILRC
ncbi:hypothetical protein G6F56_004920 [Rhizopus delemar]|nr:hypothetical protein G6F56_004920 [Rhizopus delemar]